MKGYRFYEELENKRRVSEKSRGTVFAVALDLVNPFNGDYEGAGSVFSEPNSPCCWTGISRDYLTKDCRRVSEKRARAIHPALFEYLEVE
jgi:hypothetical protein